MWSIFDSQIWKHWFGLLVCHKWDNKKVTYCWNNNNKNNCIQVQRVSLAAALHISCLLYMFHNPEYYIVFGQQVDISLLLTTWLNHHSRMLTQVCAIVLVDVTMMTSSNGIIFRVTGPLCGEFTGQRWIPHSPVSGEFPTQRLVTWSFDVFFDLRVNKRLSKQWWGWWFETAESSLWRHCNDSCRKRLCDGFYEKWAQFLHMVIPVPFVMTVVISYDYPCPCNVRITYSFGLRKYKQCRCYCSYIHKSSELVILIL